MEERITSLAEAYQAAGHKWWQVRTGQESGDVDAARADLAAARDTLYRLLEELEEAIRLGRRPPVEFAVTRQWQALVIGNKKDYGASGGAIHDGSEQRERFGRVLGLIGYYARKGSPARETDRERALLAGALGQMGMGEHNVTQPFMLRGQPLSDFEPDWTEGALADIYASEEWRADVQWRLDRLDALSDQDYQRLLDADQVANLVHPWSSYDEASFDYLMKSWIPRAVPVPQAGTWSAKAIAAAYPEWPMLYVLLPFEHPCIDIYSYVNADTRDEDRRKTLDAYGSDWARTAVYKLPGIEVGYWPDSGDPLLLVQADRAVHPIGIARYNVPPVPGEVRIRIVNFAIDQTGEKRDGEWSEGIRITHAYADSQARAVYSDRDYSEYGDDFRFRRGGRWYKWATSTIGAPPVPIDATGQVDWTGRRMPVSLAQARAAEADRQAKYTAPPGLVEQMIEWSREMWRGHKDVLRWRLALSALRVDDYLHFPPMTAQEAQRWANAPDARFQRVADEIEKVEMAFTGKTTRTPEPIDPAAPAAETHHAANEETRETVIAEAMGHVSHFTSRNNPHAAARWQSVVDRLNRKGGISDGDLTAWLAQAKAGGWRRGLQTLPKAIAVLE